MTLIEYLTQNDNRSRICLPRTYQSEVMAYKRIDANDNKEQRDTTMSEFYGGAVVD